MPRPAGCSKFLQEIYGGRHKTQGISGNLGVSPTNLVLFLTIKIGNPSPLTKHRSRLLLLLQAWRTPTQCRCSSLAVSAAAARQGSAGPCAGSASSGAWRDTTVQTHWTGPMWAAFSGLCRCVGLGLRGLRAWCVAVWAWYRVWCVWGGLVCVRVWAWLRGDSGLGVGGWERMPGYI